MAALPPGLSKSQFYQGVYGIQNGDHFELHIDSAPAPFGGTVQLIPGGAGLNFRIQPVPGVPMRVVTSPSLAAEAFGQSGGGQRDKQTRIFASGLAPNGFVTHAELREQYDAYQVGGAYMSDVYRKGQQLAAAVAQNAANAATIGAQLATIAGHVGAIAARDAMIAAREATIMEKNKAIAERDATIQKHVGDIAQHVGTIAQQEETIKARDAAIAAKDKTIVEKEKAIGEHEKAIGEQVAKINALEQEIQGLKELPALEHADNKPALQPVAIVQALAAGFAQLGLKLTAGTPPDVEDDDDDGNVVGDAKVKNPEEDTK